MSQRKTTLQNEEGASASPVRRSTRIANSPAPPSPAPATLKRRRSSASEASGPAKISTRKRLSQDVLSEERPQTPSGPEGDPASTPSKRRGRPPKKIEDTDTTANALKGRSIRGQSSSPTRAGSEPPSAKPRGRRASLSTQSTPLEAIAENESKVEAKNARAVRAARRGSVDSTTEEKSDGPRPTARRSMRGRSASVEIIEEESAKSVANDLKPIHEEEAQEIKIEPIEANDEQKKDADTVIETEEKDTSGDIDFQLVDDDIPQEKTNVNETNQKESENADNVDSGTILDKIEELVELTAVIPEKPVPKDVASPKVKEADKLIENEGAPIPPQENMDSKISQEKPIEADAEMKEKTESNDKSMIKEPEAGDSLVNSVRRSPRKLEPLTQPLNGQESLPSVTLRRSLRLSHSGEKEQQVESSPNKSKSFSEGDPAVTKGAAQDSQAADISKSPDVLTKRVVSPIISKMKQDSADTSFGSDSFPLNVTIPSVPITSEEDKSATKSKIDEQVMNSSTGSNTSDKENTDSTNLIRSPSSKKEALSLSVTSTPKAEAEIRINLTQAVIADKVADIVEAEKIFDNTNGNESVIEIDNSHEFGTSPVKRVMKEPLAIPTQSRRDEEDEMMDSFVDEVFAEPQDEKHEENGVEDVPDVQIIEPSKVTSEEVKVVPPITEISKKLNMDETVVLNNPKKDEKSEKEKIPEQVTVVTEIELTTAPISPLKNNEGISVVKPQATSEEKSPAPEIISKSSNAGPVIVKEMESEDDIEDIHESVEEFLSNEASEGEEDTPSEDSNEIVDEGESLHSSESDIFEYSDDYEDDSFIADDDSVELLSGNEEFDICDKPSLTEKKRNRIICITDSSEEEDVEEVVKDGKQENSASSNESKMALKRKKLTPTKIESPKKVSVGLQSSGEAKISQEEDIVEISDNTPSSPSRSKIKILEDITIVAHSPKRSSVLINQTDDLESLESIGKHLNIEIPKEPLPSLSTPNTSVSESTKRKSRHSTSLNIQEEVNVNDIKGGEINEKIARAVEFFIASIKEQTGNVSLNVSLDYAQTSSPEDPKQKQLPNEDSKTGEESPKKIQRPEMKNALIQYDPECVSEKEPKIIQKDEEPPTKQQKRRKRKATRHEQLVDSLVEECLKEPIISMKQKEEENTSSERKKKRLSSPLPPRYQDVDDAKVHKNKKHTLEDALNTSLPVSLPDVDLEVESVPKKKNLKKKNKQQSQSPENSKIPKALSLTEYGPSQIFEEDRSLSIRKIPLDARKKRKMSQNMLVEDEPDASLSKSEIATEMPSQLHSKPNKKKLKKFKPNTSQDTADWNVTADLTKPSIRNKDKMRSVTSQIQQIRENLFPNDFKNQMIYSSKVPRTDSKNLMKKKQTMKR